jgi:hypothetical protein
MKTIRCSSLDSLFACTPSVLDETLTRINASGPEAELGKIVHSLGARHVMGERFDIAGECNARGWADVEAVGPLVGALARAWVTLEGHFPEETRTVERAVTGARVLVKRPVIASYSLAGTVDVIAKKGENQVVFADWKSGYVDEGYHHQINGYAWCIWCMLGRPDEVEITGVAVFLRHGYQRVVKYDAARLKEWEHDLTHNVLPRLHDFSPGAHCPHCEIYAQCPARLAMLGGTLQAAMYPTMASKNDPHKAFLANVQAALANVSPATRNDLDVVEGMTMLRDRVKLAEQWLKDANALIRGAVERAGGERGIKLADGTRLALVPRQTRSLDAAKAKPVFLKHLTAAEIDGAAKLSLPKLMGLAVGKQIKAQRRVVKDKIERELEAAGAITATAHERLELLDDAEESEFDDGNDEAVGPGQPDARERPCLPAGDSEREAGGGDAPAGGTDRPDEPDPADPGDGRR